MKIINKTLIEMGKLEYEILDQAIDTLHSIYNGLSDYNLSVGRFSTENIMKIITDIQDLITAINNYDNTDEEEF